MSAARTADGGLDQSIIRYPPVLMKRTLRPFPNKARAFTAAAALFFGLAGRGFSQTPVPTWGSEALPIQSPQVHVSGTNLIVNLVDGFGFPGAQFCVVATTNLSLPKWNWIYVATNSFDQSGGCSLVFPMEPDKPRRFYCLTWPVP